MTVSDLIKALASEVDDLSDEVFIGVLASEKGEVFNVERVQRIRKTKYGVVLEMYPHPTLTNEEILGEE